MATDFMQYAAKLQEESLTALKRMQEAQIAALRQGREMFADEPSPTKAIELGYDYALKVLELQKQYALIAVDILNSAQKDATQATVRAAQTAANSANTGPKAATHN